MLLARRLTSRVAARDSAGFTLVETLIAMVAGITVTLALFMTLEVSVRQTARLTDVAQASQLGRTTMTRMMDELHSACLAPGFTPVQEGSTENKLILVNAFSESAEIPSTGARKDEIAWNEKEKRLTDFTYLSKAESAWPTFVFSTTATPASGVIIGEGVTQRESAKVLQPIFTYYKYATKASTSTSSSETTLNETEPLTGTKGVLSKEEAESVASVAVNFSNAPTKGGEAGSSAVQADTAAGISGQATFAFSAPSSEATIVDGPCK